MSYIKNYGDNGNGFYTNPIIWQDFPDPDVIRVGNAFYMTTTSMYFSPGCPIMRSYDLVNWEIINYVYSVLDNSDAQALRNGKNAYGKGQWASSLRYKNGTFYVAFASYTTKRTYIYQTKDIEKGNWDRFVINGVYHDLSLFFDDDGKAYFIYGEGIIRIIELNNSVTDIKPGGVSGILVEKPFIECDENAHVIAEGYHVYKINGKYYIFFCSWPRGGRKIQSIYISDNLLGEYKGRVILDDNMEFGNYGVSQGGIVDTSDGSYYTVLMQDRGAVGRVVTLLPLRFENGIPVIGRSSDAPVSGKMPLTSSGKTNFEFEDDFENITTEKGFLTPNPFPLDKAYEHNGSTLKIGWEWNHNPDNRYWSLTERQGWLRLKTSHLCSDIEQAKNTLTIRPFGPKCSGYIKLDTSLMKDGDTAGIAALQKKYGMSAVRVKGNKKYIIMASAENCSNEDTCIELNNDIVYLRIDFIFGEDSDKAYFYYSLDCEKWEMIGTELSMVYDLAHFTGYRFALFNFASKHTGGAADFDYFIMRAL